MTAPVPWYIQWIRHPSKAGKPPKLSSWKAQRATDQDSSARSAEQQKVQPSAFKIVGHAQLEARKKR